MTSLLQKNTSHFSSACADTSSRERKEGPTLTDTTLQLINESALVNTCLQRPDSSSTRPELSSHQQQEFCTHLFLQLLDGLLESQDLVEQGAPEGVP